MTHSLNFSQGEQDEKDGLDRAGELGAHDAHCNVEPDPSRHDLHALERTEYHIAYHQEVREMCRSERIHQAVAADLDLQALMRKTIVGLGLDAMKPMRQPSQRFHVRYFNGMNCLLNPDDRGFATYDEAAIDRDRILEDDMAETGDYIVIEDQGCTIELHEIRRS